MGNSTEQTATDDRLTLDQQVCFKLSVAARDIVSLYRPFLEPLGLTHPQYLVMVTLWERSASIAVKELSSLLKLDPPSLSPVLKRLHAAGLIDRQRDPSDERSVRISLTEQGRALRAPASDVPAAIIARLGMSVEELDHLQQILLKVIERARVRPSGGPAVPDQI